VLFIAELRPLPAPGVAPFDDLDDVLPLPSWAPDVRKDIIYGLIRKISSCTVRGPELSRGANGNRFNRLLYLTSAYFRAEIYTANGNASWCINILCSPFYNVGHRLVPPLIFPLYLRIFLFTTSSTNCTPGLLDGPPCTSIFVCQLSSYLLTYPTVNVSTYIYLLFPFPSLHE